jgi:thiamine biosynthesis lipoprotein
VTVAGPVVEVAEAAMGTVFAIQLSDVTGHWSPDALRAHAHELLATVHEVEQTCSRFDTSSELARLCTQVGRDVAASPLLVELVALAVAMAEASDGAFDPTIGRAMMQQGFDRAWRTGLPIGTGGPAVPAPHAGDWRDIRVNAEQGTIRLDQPMLLDLGALAKGFAVDLMIAALADGLSCSIHAGGDVRCAGPHPDARPWRIGIRDPLVPDALTAIAHVAHGAVCTTGCYERISDRGAHHLLDPRTGASAVGFRSVSVVAPTAVVADGLSTAAFVLGPTRAAAWLEAQGVDALLIDDHAAHTIVAGAGTTSWERLS